MGFYPRTIAVFGMLRDKDIAGVARRVAGRIDRWFVAPTAGPRGTDVAQMREALQAAGVAHGAIEIHDDLASAYAGAREIAAPEDRILVFGSFVTVAEVMRARSEG
jgi:dihydrofolate synthase/folylpolyglutamate synthase